MRPVSACLNPLRHANCLKINFHKSTMIPINLEASTTTNLARVFGCAVGSMPFTYLGLPLGTTRPTIQEFMPLVCRLERELTPTITMMSYGGKLSWLNASVTSLLVFAMCTLKFPPSLLRSLIRSGADVSRPRKRNRARSVTL